MAHKIDTAAARAKLAPRRAPYWHKVRPGHFLGYRFMTKGSEGNWIAKVKRGDVVSQEPLGKLSELDESQRFEHALKLADKFFTQSAADGLVAASVLPSRVTLRDALQEYVVKKGAEYGQPGGRARARFNAIVAPFELAGSSWIDLPISKLTKKNFEDYHQWLREQPIVARRGNRRAGEARTASAVNRDIVNLRAALNDAHRKYGIVDTWKAALARNKGADGARGHDAYMSTEERRRYLAAIAELAPGLAPLAELMMRLPVRPGALAQLTVAHFDKRRNVLHVEFDKAGAGRKLNLSADPASCELIKRACAGKIGAAPMFADPDGKPWIASTWGDVSREALKRAKLTRKLENGERLSLYCLRHSRITDLVEAGMGFFAIAQIGGTSVQMIEKHYAHLKQDQAFAFMAKVAAY
jgi:integrase